LNEFCREQGHRWVLINITPMGQGKSHVTDRCSRCDAERETVMHDAPGAFPDRTYTYPIESDLPADALAADLQALRSELQKEVTS
jgi:hypothetical protein